MSIPVEGRRAATFAAGLAGALACAACSTLECDSDDETKEALRSVQQRFKEVFAELDVDLRAADAPTRSLLGEDALQALDALVLPRPIPEFAR